ncbi:hypothetical protein CDAR_93091, partial [Caerostris darwini]
IDLPMRRRFLLSSSSSSTTTVNIVVDRSQKLAKASQANFPNGVVAQTFHT